MCYIYCPLEHYTSANCSIYRTSVQIVYLLLIWPTNIIPLYSKFEITVFGPLINTFYDANIMPIWPYMMNEITGVIHL